MACLLKLKKFLHRAFPIVLTVYCACGFFLYTVAYLYDAAHPATAPARSHQSDLDVDDIIVHGADGEFVNLAYSDLVYYDSSSSLADVYTNGCYTINGDVLFNPVTTTFAGYSISTAGLFTPVSDTFGSIYLVSSGSTFTINDKCKFLPGTCLIIEAGAELILNCDIVFYTADDYLYTYNYIGHTNDYDAILVNYGTITCNAGAIYSSDPEWSNIYGYDGDKSVEDISITEYQQVYNPVVGEADYNYGTASVPFYGYALTSSGSEDDSSGGSSDTDSGSTDSGDGDTDSGDTSEDGDSDDFGITGDDADMDITGDFSTFGSFMSATLTVFQTEFTLFGFTLSYWDVFLWSAIAGIIIIIVRRILDG